MHQGVQALQSGEADVVVGGGVNALVTGGHTRLRRGRRVLAPDGGSSFSSDADGYARSRAARARAQASRRRPSRRRRDLRGDRRQRGQPRRVKRHARPEPRTPRPGCCAGPIATPGSTRARWTTSRRTAPAPSSVTRSRLDALGRVVGRGRAADNRHCWVRSSPASVTWSRPRVRSQPGQGSHCPCTTTKIPPSINYAGPKSPSISTACTSGRRHRHPKWPQYSGHAIAGVSGFGFGGANAHLVLREVLPGTSSSPRRT